MAQWERAQGSSARRVPASHSLALPISAMTPTLLTAPDQIASRCYIDPGTSNRQIPQDGPLGSWREDGAPSSTVPSPLQAACHTHPSPSCKASSQCRGRGWMLRKILTRDRRAATSYLAPLVIPATTARSGYPRAWAKPRGSGGWDRRGQRRRYLVGQSGFCLVYIA